MSKWNIVTLDEVCSKGNSSIAQKDIKNNNRLYEIYGAGGYIKNIDFYQQSKPYVAVVKDGAGVGRTMLLPEKTSVIGTMQYLIPNESVIAEYLYYAVTYMNLAKYFTGTTIPHIYFKDYQKEKIILPPIETQHKIATTLNKVTHTIDLCNQITEKLDLLVKSRFVEMFGGIHDSNLYPYQSIDTFTSVTSGGTPDRKNNDYWENGSIPWIKTTELHNNVIHEAEESITEKGLNESSAKLVPKGTILIAMYGQGKTRGMTALLGVEASTNQACACILPCDKLNQIYLWKYLILSYDKLRTLAKGGNQPNLNGNIIKKFPILVPPITLQNQFSDFIEQTEKSKLAVKKVLEKAETLKKSLMQEYFSGQ
ncbi:MAG: restriction endonuclease subunit S [Ruminococcus sp.]|nr:restriction endonuclease subunit S [Ruminococcus sp.]